MTDPALSKRNVANKRRGARFDLDARRYLGSRGFRTVKPVAGARHDKGDIHAHLGHLVFLVECKNEKTYDLSGYVREAAVEAQNAHLDYYLALIKARGKGVAESYVVMPLWLFCDLIKEMTY
jgi:Holliday junction resolvase